ncbi:U2 small nuclear ribonucleoprotein auxiliary factor 35 kDa subunit- protein 2 [Chytridiales sp. JEL 0842]|nr:U2 small nuclear ribonucleoprotein auxiliary factor 35 kDa subunit- protein 2 [Chytridiales sp. JEL 0842]
MHQDPLLVPIPTLKGNSRGFDGDLNDDDALDGPDEGQIQKNFEEFFEDAHPEFASIGKVVQFKVCRNMVAHLRGNVYVQYEKAEDAAKAQSIFNNRFFAGRRLVCEFVPVPSWKNALCGESNRGRCPKGDQCNFLHAFKNPKNMYRDADFDWEPAPSRPHRYGGGGRRQSQTEEFRRRNDYDDLRGQSDSRKRDRSADDDQQRSSTHVQQDYSRRRDGYGQSRNEPEPYADQSSISTYRRHSNADREANIHQRNRSDTYHRNPDYVDRERTGRSGYDRREYPPADRPPRSYSRERFDAREPKYERSRYESPSRRGIEYSPRPMYDELSRTHERYPTAETFEPPLKRPLHDSDLEHHSSMKKKKKKHKKHHHRSKKSRRRHSSRSEGSDYTSDSDSEYTSYSSYSDASDRSRKKSRKHRKSKSRKESKHRSHGYDADPIYPPRREFVDRGNGYLDERSRDLQYKDDIGGTSRYNGRDVGEDFYREGNGRSERHRRETSGGYRGAVKNDDFSGRVRSEFDDRKY